MKNQDNGDNENQVALEKPNSAIVWSAPMQLAKSLRDFRWNLQMYANVRLREFVEMISQPKWFSFAGESQGRTISLSLSLCTALAGLCPPKEPCETRNVESPHAQGKPNPLLFGTACASQNGGH